MPSKSGRGHRKHAAYSKKKKDQRSAAAVVASGGQTAATNQVAPPKVSPRLNSVPTPRAPTPATYPFLGSELRRIGILSAIMVVILIVLARVLS